MDLKAPQKPMLWYNHENGLCNDITCRIESSHKDNVLWISTHNGISRFDLLSGRFHNYYKESGFPDNEFNSAASARLPDGSLLFGGLSGLMYFHPDSVPSSSYHNKAIISRFRYYEKELKKLVDFPVFFPTEISLPPYPEYFEIYLGTTELISAEKIRFRYRLRDHSDFWTYNSGKEVIKFIRLAPGKYTFEAQAISQDGYISPPVFLSIFVALPYYETWWFITIVILSILSILYLSYRYRLRQLLQEQHMRQQIADDLHDDIGNKLNIISIIAQRIVKNHLKNDTQNEELTKLIDVSRNASRNLNAMIWSVDSKKDKLSSLFDRMQDFADGYLRPLGIKFNFILKGSQQNKNIKLQARHHIIMIYQEVLTNMVKYTHPKHITININLEHETLYLEITNRFEPFTALEHNTTSANRGILSIERRTNRINGKFHWTESPEGFQAANLEVPNIFKSY